MQTSISITAKEYNLLHSAIEARNKKVTFRREDIQLTEDIVIALPLDFLDLCKFMSMDESDELLFIG